MNQRLSKWLSSARWLQVKRCPEVIWWSFPLIAAGLLYSVHLKGDLFGDELITYEWVAKGTPLIETGKPPNALNVDIMLSRLALKLVGEPWAIRLPSLVFGLLTIIMVARLGRYLAGARAGLVAMWIAAFSPMLVEFAAEGRPYTIYCFFSTALLFYTLRFIEHESVASALPLTVCSTLGTLSRTLFVANLAFAGLWYLYKRRTLTKYSVGVALAVLPFAVRLYLVAQHYEEFAPKTSAGETGVSLGNFIVRGVCALNFGLNLVALPQLDVARNVPISWVVQQNLLTVSLALISLMGLLIGITRLWKTERPNVCLVGSACIIPATIMVLLAETGYSIIREKYLIGIVGIYTVLIAMTFLALARRWAGAWVILSFSVVTAISLQHYLFRPELYSRRTFMGKLNAELQARVSGQDATVAYHFLRRDPWYLSVFDRPDGRHVDIYDDVIQNGGSITEFAHSLDASCHGRIYFVCDEASRLWLDKDGTVLHILSRSRSFCTRAYGRNLVLYIFESRATDGFAATSSRSNGRMIKLSTAH